jgi:rare lipoprotein A
MRTLQFLGSLAAFVAGTALTSVQAASLTSPDLAPFSPAERTVPTQWDNKFLRIPPSLPQSPSPLLASARGVQVGQASWYGPGFFGGRTANGEVFRPGTLTAAHPSLAFGTKVRVTNLYNGRSTVVRINDRGPFTGGRIIDLAHGAAQVLGLTASGVADVKLEVID